MITIKKTNDQQAARKILTIEELVAGIGDFLTATDGAISPDRLHAGDSHLRVAMRTLGYKPREIFKEDKVATTTSELLDQLTACIQATGEITEAQHQDLHLHLSTTHSNCAAEAGGKIAPQLKEAPGTVKDPPISRQNINPEGNALMATKFQDLLKIVDDLNAEPERTEKIVAPVGTSKLALVNLILKAKGLAVFALFLFALLFSFSASALESFNATNILANGASTLYGFTSYPTNSISTNLVITGYTTNGSVITTNGYFPGQYTGKGVEVRNYTFVPFKFTGLCQSSNGGTLTLQLGRAVSDSPPQSIVNTNSALLTNSDWETTYSATVSIPIPRGTNQVVTYITNLDETYIKPAMYLGIYTATNSGQVNDSISNAWFGIGKKIIPVSLSGGNF